MRLVLFRAVAGLLLGLALVVELAAARLALLFDVVARRPIRAVRAPVPGVAALFSSVLRHEAPFAGERHRNALADGSLTVRASSERATTNQSPQRVDHRIRRRAGNSLRRGPFAFPPEARALSRLSPRVRPADGGSERRASGPKGFDSEGTTGLNVPAALACSEERATPNCERQRGPRPGPHGLTGVECARIPSSALGVNPHGMDAGSVLSPRRDQALVEAPSPDGWVSTPLAPKIDYARERGSGVSFEDPASMPAGPPFAPIAQLAESAVCTRAAVVRIHLGAQCRRGMKKARPPARAIPWTRPRAICFQPGAQHVEVWIRHFLFSVAAPRPPLGAFAADFLGGAHA